MARITRCTAGRNDEAGTVDLRTVGFGFPRIPIVFPGLVPYH